MKEKSNAKTFIALIKNNQVDGCHCIDDILAEQNEYERQVLLTVIENPRTITGVGPIMKFILSHVHAYQFDYMVMFDSSLTEDQIIHSLNSDKKEFNAASEAWEIVYDKKLNKFSDS